MNEERERVVKINVSVYPSDLLEIDVLSRKYYRGNRSLALRMIIDYWRVGHTLDEITPGDELKQLLDALIGGQITPEEFKNRVHILVMRVEDSEHTKFFNGCE